MNMTHNDFIILKKVFKIENHFFKKLNSIITNNPNNIKKTKEIPWKIQAGTILLELLVVMMEQ